VEREEFESLVEQALAALPPEFQERIENVAVSVEDWPSHRQLREAGIGRREGLLGLYEGVPHTERGVNYNLVLPDRITLFQRPIELSCRTRSEAVKEIGRVVRHEIAHHFGLSDAALDEIEGD
jgi:predicted Zn-dependent protease with MMP-like domain